MRGQPASSARSAQRSNSLHVVEGIALPAPVRHGALLHPLTAPGEGHVGQATMWSASTTTVACASGLARPVMGFGPITAER